MDGDLPDLPGLIELRRRKRFLLYVDEAHSVGVLGAGGRGLGEHFGIDPAEVDFWMGTLSKALASCGGYVAGRRDLVEYLRYTAPGFVFSAGITPANAAAALAAVREIEAEPARVARVAERSRFFRERARRRGLSVGGAEVAPVVPYIVGETVTCLRLAERLRERGFGVPPMVYPAVEDEAARLRFFVTASHSEDQIERAVGALAEEAESLGLLG